MAVAKFYHLTRDPLEALLPTLIVKALDIGLRVALRGTDAGRMQGIDRMLLLRSGQTFPSIGALSSWRAVSEAVARQDEEAATANAKAITATAWAMIGQTFPESAP